jgi:hypothetical protein
MDLTRATYCFGRQARTKACRLTLLGRSDHDIVDDHEDRQSSALRSETFRLLASREKRWLVLPGISPSRSTTSAFLLRLTTPWLADPRRLDTACT